MSEALFQSQSAPYASFKGAGTHYEGIVVRTGQVQSRKYVPPSQRAAGKQGELEFWPDGKPKMTAIVTLQTDQRDPSIPGDDGQRSLWISGKSMTAAVKEAIANAGASRRGIEVGGWLAMTFTHETPPEEEGLNPTKHYAVEYRVPTQSAQDNINILGGVSAQTAQPTQPTQPTQAAAAPVAETPAPAPASTSTAGQFDLTNMSPEAKAALEAMLAAQGGAQQ